VCASTRSRLRGETLDWTGIAKTVGTTGVVVLVVGYFLRQVFRQVLSRDLEKFKADLSAKHDTEIERLRNDLRIAASQHQTRFTRLHEPRAEVIAGLYGRFVRAHAAFGAYLTIIKPGGEPDPREAMERADEFVQYFNENRIYFEESLCADLDSAEEVFRRALSDMAGYAPGMPGRPRQWVKTWESFKGEFPAIRAKVERQFRDLMGVKESQSSGQRTTDKGPPPQ